MDFKHLKESNMTYQEHFKRSIYISSTLFTASVKNLVHAIHPDSFATTASDAVKELYEFIFPKELEVLNTDNDSNSDKELP